MTFERIPACGASDRMRSRSARKSSRAAEPAHPAQHRRRGVLEGQVEVGHDAGRAGDGLDAGPAASRPAAGRTPAPGRGRARAASSGSSALEQAQVAEVLAVRRGVLADQEAARGRPARPASAPRRAPPAGGRETNAPRNAGIAQKLQRRSQPGGELERRPRAGRRAGAAPPRTAAGRARRRRSGRGRPERRPVPVRRAGAPCRRASTRAPAAAAAAAGASGSRVRRSRGTCDAGRSPCRIGVQVGGRGRRRSRSRGRRPPRAALGELVPYRSARQPTATTACVAGRAVVAQVGGLEQGVDRVLLRLLDEAAGVDHRDVGLRRVVHEAPAGGLEPPGELLGVDLVAGAPEGDEGDACAVPDTASAVADTPTGVPALGPGRSVPTEPCASSSSDAHRAGRRQPRAALGQVVQPDARQRRGERAGHVLEVDERDEVGLLRVPGDLGERQHRRRRRRSRASSSSGSRKLRPSPLATTSRRSRCVARPVAMCVEHVGVDVVVGAELGPGEDGVAERADRLDPAAHRHRAAGRHVGEDAALDLAVAGAGEQPPRDGVEAGPGRPASGGPPMTFDSVMSMFGASQTSRSSSGRPRRPAVASGSGCAPRRRSSSPWSQSSSCAGLPRSSTRPASSSGGSSPRMRASVPGRSSGFTSTSRALLPSLGPTTPRDSSRSISRPALAKPTRSLRCSIEVEPNCVVTTSSAACSSRSRSSPMSSSTCFLTTATGDVLAVARLQLRP